MKLHPAPAGSTSAKRSSLAKHRSGARAPARFPEFAAQQTQESLPFRQAKKLHPALAGSTSAKLPSLAKGTVQVPHLHCSPEQSSALERGGVLAFQSQVKKKVGAIFQVRSTGKSHWVGGQFSAKRKLARQKHPSFLSAWRRSSVASGHSGFHKGALAGPQHQIDRAVLKATSSFHWFPIAKL